MPLRFFIFFYTFFFDLTLTNLMNKNLLTAICLLSLSTMAVAQEACYTFDEQTVTLEETSHTFNTFGDGASGFLQDWYVTSGTPSIYYSGQLAGVDAFEGNQFVLNGVCNIAGEYAEGVSLSYNFVQGNSYTVSLAVRNAGLAGNAAVPLDIDFLLLSDTVAFNYQFASGCTQVPSVPSDAVVAHSISGFADNTWQVVTFNISNLTADYTQLWFRANRAAGAPQFTTFFLMDSLCVSQLPPPSTCYTFDEQSVTLEETSHTFNTFGDGASGFLQDWYVTSGTPSIYYSGQLAGVDAFEGNQFVLTGVCNIAGEYAEGVSLSYNFVQGNSYTVSLAVRNAGLAGNAAVPLDIDFLLLSDTVAFNYQFASGCTQVPSVPSDAVVAHSISGFADNTWQVVTFNISNLTADYTQLWFRANRAAGAPQFTTFFLMDSLCLADNGASVGIAAHQDAVAPALVLYPNPTNGVLNVGFNGGSEPSYLEIFNAIGQQVLFQEVKSSTSKEQIALQLGHLVNGIYTLRLSSRSGQSFQKFVLQH
jgi:hypothetical protein